MRPPRPKADSEAATSVAAKQSGASSVKDHGASAGGSQSGAVRRPAAARASSGGRDKHSSSSGGYPSGGLSRPDGSPTTRRSRSASKPSTQANTKSQQGSTAKRQEDKGLENASQPQSVPSTSPASGQGDQVQVRQGAAESSDLEVRKKKEEMQRKRGELLKKQARQEEADELLSQFAEMVAAAKGTEDHREAHSILRRVLQLVPGHPVATAYNAALANFLDCVENAPEFPADELDGDEDQEESEEEEELEDDADVEPDDMCKAPKASLQGQVD